MEGQRRASGADARAIRPPARQSAVEPPPRQRRVHAYSILLTAAEPAASDGGRRGVPFLAGSARPVVFCIRPDPSSRTSVLASGDGDGGSL